MISKKVSQELKDAAIQAREMNLNRVADNLEVAAEKFPQVFSYHEYSSRLAISYVRSSVIGALYEYPHGLETLIEQGEVELTTEIQRIRLTLNNLRDDVKINH